MVANKKNDDNDNESSSSNRLLILCCTANMGNAQPTASSLQAWVPKNGAIQTVTALDSACQAKMNGGPSSSFDIVMVGMQEATWKTKKKGKDGKAEVEEGDADEEESDNDESERSAAGDLATPAAAATKEEVAKRDEMKKNWSSASTASFLKKMTTTEDSKYMRTLLQENLGSAYNMIQEYQRGQMRLYLFVNQSLVHEITNLDSKFCICCCC